MRPLPRPDHRPTFRKLALLFVVSAPLGCASAQAPAAHAEAPPAVRADTPPTLTGFARSTLEIRSHGGRHWFKIYLAQTNEQQMQGLMFVRDLPADQGMLFPLDMPRVMTMWMKNTLIPLDMLFIDDTNHVVCVRAKAVPQSLDLISCDKPVKSVLEIGGGQAAARGLAVGDSVVQAATR
jgi:uncharacterized membrane protein (UPF0127 family)